MEKLFNSEWQFVKKSIGTNPLLHTEEKNWQDIDLPHDYLIYQTNDLYETSIGWYKKNFVLDKAEYDLSTEQIVIRFDGVYMNSTFYVNNQKVGEWKYGYTAFEFDITSFLKYGDNELFMEVVYECPNTRWYSGAGIYRDVTLITRPHLHFSSEGIYVSSVEKDNDYVMSVNVEIEKSLKKLSYSPCDLGVKVCLLDAEGRQLFDEQYDLFEFDYEMDGASSYANESETENEIVYSGSRNFYVLSPNRWEVNKPYLYDLKISLVNLKTGVLLDEKALKTGFRTIGFDPDLGLIVNGHKVKVHGSCEHHDLGCLGSAFNKEAMRIRMLHLQDMGVNAIRSAHNPAARHLLDLADELGMLVMDEILDMWEKPKTEYDYARFFNSWVEKDIKSWIRRDRNHPSVFMWSIGNEIYDTHASYERGVEIIRMFKKEIAKYDPKENARITIGSNYIPWENTRKCVEELKLVGYNYAEYLYEKDHVEHPDWIIYGSETASVVMSRGIYHFPAKECIMADDDEQCSALDNCATSWGAKSIRKCVTDDRDAKHVFGMFIWTGFDYIGEPTPYHTKNSYFGVIDTAGFNKDPYYIYKSAWKDVSDDPFVHIFPYWDFNEGQIIDLRVASNAPCVEVFLNGESLGKKYFDRETDLELLATYSVPYTKGEIIALGYDENGKEIAREKKNSFGNPKKIVLTCNKPIIKANGADITYVTIEVVDENGIKVENANNLVKVTVSGNARLLGLDNGDSTDFDPYKTNVRKLFSGKLAAAIGSLEEAGSVKVLVEGIGLESAEIEIEAVKAEKIEGISCKQRIESKELNDEYIPVRRITIKTDKGQKFASESKEITVEAVIEPENASFDEIVFRATNDLGVTSNLAEIVKTDKKNVIILKALGDGDFRLRATANNGDSRVKVISELEFAASGIGEAFHNPYEFIAGSLATLSNEELGNGNERGVATGRGKDTWVGYERVNFGPFGSDTITIPIFELDNKPTPFEIWDGIPNEVGSEKLADCVYDKKMIWNEYQAETYKLSRRLKGMRTLCFMFHKKVHIKGFSFEKQNKAYAYLQATDNSTLYGDTFTVSETDKGVIEHIGNNVTMLYDDMNFEQGTTKLVIEGKSSLPVNTIHVRFKDENGEIKKICEFKGSEEYVKQTFDIGKIEGKYDVSFVFLPGCDFTFKGFEFEK